MKLTPGRGIKFFKHPVVRIPGTLIAGTYGFGKKQVKNAINGVTSFSSNIIRKDKKKK
jgi:hypothetical protein